MKKIFIILFLLTVNTVFSQITSPNGYTNHGLRKYGDHANPGADSLNQNIIDIDNILTTIENSIKGNILKNPDSIKYVSPKFANDTNNYTFATIQSAINNSGNGTLIYVYPGLYNEADTGKNGVNIYLSAGAVLSYSSSDIPTLVLSGVTCTISGEGLITQGYTTIVSGSLHAIKITNSSNVTINCNITNYGSANESGNGWRFGSCIYIKNSNVNFSNKLIYSSYGTALGFDSLATATIDNSTIKSRNSTTIGVFSRRKININNSYICMDSTTTIGSYSIIHIKSDSSKLYLNNCVIEQLDNLNMQFKRMFIELVSTANRELERLYISNCKFYSWDVSPNFDPIYIAPIYIEDVSFQTGTGTISKSADNDTVRGTGTAFTTEMIYTPNLISPKCLGTNYYGKIQTVLNDTTLVLNVASGSNPPNRLRSPEFTKCAYYYTDENGSVLIDTSNYSIVSFQGDSWMPTAITGKIKIMGTYSYGLISSKKISSIERISSTNYKNNTLKKVLDGKIYIDSANMFLVKLNHNTSITISGTFSSPTPINVLVYRSDTTSYSLLWDNKVIWAEGITPPIPDVDMIDMYSFVAVQFTDETINVSANLLIGTLIKSFPIPY